jgi:hypothetical protein
MPATNDADKRTRLQREHEPTHPTPRVLAGKAVGRLQRGANRNASADRAHRAVTLKVGWAGVPERACSSARFGRVYDAKA